ncbi:MAG: sugar transferase, partial [Clostridiales bacterium]|nr:sugar transferase [Clostridiales bacterium]
MKRKNGVEILKEINNMTQEQLINYREKNREFVEQIEKRKIKNVISRMIKRIIDIIAGIVGSILLIPITIIVAIMNIINKDFGNLFYTQYRIGKNGKKFKIIKFRSMQK